MSGTFRCFALLAILASGCSYTPLTVTRLAPAELDIATGKAVAVTTIAGNGGESLATALTEALVQTGRFQVLERRRLEAVMSELRFSAAGHVSDETAMSFGEMTGAALLVVGEVARAEYQEQLKAEVQKCSKDGKLVECTVNTRSASYALRVSLEVVETESGRVIGARTLAAEKKQEVKATDLEPPQLAVEPELSAECRAEVVAAFARMVAPHQVQVTVFLRTDDKLPELEAGNVQAQIGNWTGAIEQYQSAVAKAALQPAAPELQAMAYYNLGIGYGYSGAYKEGLEALQQAITLDPDPRYREQLGVVRGFQEDAVRLARQVGDAH